MFDNCLFQALRIQTGFNYNTVLFKVVLPLSSTYTTANFIICRKPGLSLAGPPGSHVLSKQLRIQKAALETVPHGLRISISCPDVTRENAKQKYQGIVISINKSIKIKTSDCPKFEDLQQVRIQHTSGPNSHSPRHVLAIFSRRVGNVAHRHQADLCLAVCTVRNPRMQGTHKKISFRCSTTWTISWKFSTHSNQLLTI